MSIWDDNMDTPEILTKADAARLHAHVVTWPAILAILLGVGGATIAASYKAGAWRFDTWSAAHATEHRAEQTRTDYLVESMKKQSADMDDVKTALRQFFNEQGNGNAAAKLRDRPAPAPPDGGRLP